MENNSIKNKRKHKRVGILKKFYDKEIEKFEKKNGVKPNREQRRKIQNKVLKNAGIRFAAGIGAVFIIGNGAIKLTSGNTIEEPENKTSIRTKGDAEDFKKSLIVEENDKEGEKTTEREQLLKQVQEEIGKLNSSDDVLNYMKKIYKTEYTKATGTSISDFKLICMKDGTIKSVDNESEKNIECIGYKNGEYTNLNNKDSAWYLAKEDSTVLKNLQNFILVSERIREEEVRKANGITKQEYIDENMKPTMVDALMKYYDEQTKNETLEIDVQSGGFEPGE